MIGRVIAAIAYGLLVGIVVLIVGVVLASLGIKPLTALGDVLERFCWAIGILVAILAFFGSWSLPGRAGHRRARSMSLSKLRITVPVTLNGEPLTATRVAFVVDVKTPMIVRLDILADVEVEGDFPLGLVALEPQRGKPPEPDSLFAASEALMRR